MFFLVARAQQDGIGLFAELDSVIGDVSSPAEMTSSVLWYILNEKSVSEGTIFLRNHTTGQVCDLGTPLFTSHNCALRTGKRYQNQMCIVRKVRLICSLKSPWKNHNCNSWIMLCQLNETKFGNEILFSFLKLASLNWWIIISEPQIWLSSGLFNGRLLCIFLTKQIGFRCHIYMYILALWLV